MRDLVFWGATGHSKVLHETIHNTDLHLVALVDNRILPPPIAGVPVLHGESGLDAWLTTRESSSGLWGAVAVAGGRGADRLSLMDMLQARGVTIVTLTHRTAFVAHNAMVGEGCQILAHSSVCACVRLGRGVILNTASSADHDCDIGDGVHLAPGARLAGEITVGARAFIGTGAVILPRIAIGEDAIVGAGAVVTKDVPPGTTVVGNPARPMRT